MTHFPSGTSAEVPDVFRYWHENTGDAEVVKKDIAFSEGLMYNK